jgi:hypothetical protein
MEIQRLQHGLNKTNSKNRTHYIPRHLYEFALKLWGQNAGVEVLPEWPPKRGRPSGTGQGKYPTLADVFYALIVQGEQLLNDYPAIIKPVFKEYGSPGFRNLKGKSSDFVSVVIRVRKMTAKYEPDQLNEKLENIKSFTKDGTFEVLPSLDSKGRILKEVGLASIAVKLMDVYMQHANGTPFEEIK